VIAAVETGPQNLRVYGVLLRAGSVLMSTEHVAGRDILKFPGGGVEPGETPEAALCREFQEESGLEIAPIGLLHVPGTLFSPWTLAPYTPLYYLVVGEGNPCAPDHEPLTLGFMTPEDAIRSARMAEPEIEALRRALRTEL
jgi:8-oxo-dGTP pyrophosphatase MutT (NUDIX family)